MSLQLIPFFRYLLFIRILWYDEILLRNWKLIRKLANKSSQWPLYSVISDKSLLFTWYCWTECLEVYYWNLNSFGWFQALYLRSFFLLGISCLVQPFIWILWISPSNCPCFSPWTLWNGFHARFFVIGNLSCKFQGLPEPRNFCDLWGSFNIIWGSGIK